MPDYGKTGINESDRVSLNDLRGTVGSSNLGGTSILEIWKDAFENSASDSHWQTRYGHLNDGANATNVLTETNAAANATDDLKSISGDYWSRKTSSDGTMTTQGFYDTTYESVSTPSIEEQGEDTIPGTTNYSLHRSPENYFINTSSNTPLWSGAETGVTYTPLPSAEQFEQRGENALKNYADLKKEDE